jgi:lipoate-protein ligase A
VFRQLGVAVFCQTPKHLNTEKRNNLIIYHLSGGAMDLYHLGKVPWEDSQLIYHALAELGREGLILLSPATAYVCIGFHQDAEREVDLDYCKAHRIPVFRRDVGGGAVYLDGGQLFFQLVLRRDDPRVPASKEGFYRKFLEPVVNIYRRVGIPAEYKPINDVMAGARKISGSGVGEIGAGVVFVGNIIVDFNHAMMARVLRVPDEKFRDKVHKSLVENLSTIRAELGDARAAAWTEDRLTGLMIEEFAALLGPLEPQPIDGSLRAKMDALRPLMLSEAWLIQRRGRGAERTVKIRSGVHLVQKVHKAPGGLIRADFEVHEGRLGGVCISGDFFCYPARGIRRLEAVLEGRMIPEIREPIAALYSGSVLDTPGVGVEDWLAVFRR